MDDIYIIHVVAYTIGTCMYFKSNSSYGWGKSAAEVFVSSPGGSFDLASNGTCRECALVIAMKVCRCM